MFIVKSLNSNEYFLSKYMLTSALALTMTASIDLNALPQGGNVIDGQATIETPAQNYMQINQSTNQAIINWQTFNIGVDEHAHFQQPSTNSLTINRVNAANGNSSILGQLSATGQIFLLNPAGVLIGPNAQVNVGGILASTSDLNMEAYKLGRIELLPNANFTGSIINKGTINVAPGGYAAFVAPNVVNNGVINAHLGHVQLSSGEYFTVDLYGDNLIHLKIPDDQLSSEAKNYSVVHDGKIYADGGTIKITSADAENIVSNIISTDGLLRADSVGTFKGNIILSATDTGYIEFKSNSETYAAGGYLKATAKDIKLASNSLIDVSSKDINGNGGEVYIGGNYQGKLLSDDDFNAKTVIMEKDASILASAHGIGNGGKIILWSDDTTQVAGTLKAEGGTDGGNGGLIETSGKIKLDIKPEINISTASLNNSGVDGEWLLDPIYLIVDNALAAAISTALASSNVTISTSDNSTVNILNEVDSSILGAGPGANGAAPPGAGSFGDIEFANDTTKVSWSTSNKFSVLADDDIIFTAPAATVTIESTGTGGIHLQTNRNAQDPTACADCAGRIDFGITGTSTISSTGGGLVEIYHDPLAFGTPEFTGGLPGVTGQLIEYQLVYNSVIGRTLDDINAIIDISPTNQNFALNENITLTAAFEGIGGDAIASGNAFTGSFDGLGYQISDLTINNSGNRGFFNETDNTSYLASETQFFKNIEFLNGNVTAFPDSINSSGLDQIAAGTLIGYATIGNAGLSLDDVNVRGGSVTTITDPLTSSPIFGSAGGVIGNLNSIAAGNNVTLNLVRSDSNSVSSSYTAAGLIGQTNADNISITGSTTINNTSITASLPGSVAADDLNGLTSVFAAGLIGQTTNPLLNLDATNSNILVNGTISANNTLPGQDAYAAGIIAAAQGNSYIFDNISVTNTGSDTLSASVSSHSATIAGQTGNTVYAGGVIAKTVTPINSISFVDDVLITGAPTSSINLTDKDGDFTAFAGGIFGDANVTTLSYSGPNLSIDTAPVASVNVNSATTANLATYSGGLAGRESLSDVIYDTVTSTGGATASTISTSGLSPNALSYAGGISGYSTVSGTTNFNSGSTSITDSVSSTTTNTSDGMSYAGGLYGFSDNSNLVIDSTLTTGLNTLTATTNSQSGTNYAYAGGLFGNSGNIVYDINVPVIINSINGINAITTGINSGTYNALAGGLFGTTSIANLAFDRNITVNADINSSSTGTDGDYNAFSGGILGMYGDGTQTLSYESTILIDSTPHAEVQGETAKAYAGGLIGKENLVASNYTATSNTTTNGAESSINTGSGDNAESFAGGLVGHSTVDTNTFNSSATLIILDTGAGSGDITATTNNTDNGNSFAGGLYGFADGNGLTTLDGSFSINPASIQATTNSTNGSTSSNAFAGGLFGDTAAISLNLNSDLILDTVNGLSAITTGVNTGNYNAFAGGAFGSSDIANLNFANNLTVNTTITSSSTGTDGTYNAYSGGVIGMFGDNNNTLTYNDAIVIDTRPTATSGSSTATSKASSFAGGLTGQENLNTVNYNASVTTNGAGATVNTGSGNNSESYAGGLSGSSTVTINNLNAAATINTTSTGTGSGVISATTNNTDNGKSYAGGLYGRAQGTGTTTINSTLSLNPASIESTTTSSDGTITSNSYAGGLFGDTAAITLSLNVPTVINSTGGIIATTNGSASNAYKAFAGGIFGNTNITNLLLTNSLTVNAAVNSTTNDSSDNGGDYLAYAGGIAGLFGTGANSLTFNNTVNITSTPSATVNGVAVNSPDKKAFAGGLTGYNNLSNLAINNSAVITTTGAVASANGGSDTYAYSGGLSGYNKTSTNTIQSSAMITTNGNIDATSTDADDNGLSYAGGLFGYTEATTMSINNSLNLNPNRIRARTVSNNGLTASNSFAGGLFGNTNAMTFNLNAPVSINSTNGISATTIGVNSGTYNSNAGGIFGTTSIANLTFANALTINSAIASSAQDNSGTGGLYNAYAGGILGQYGTGNNNLVYNGNVTVNTAPSATVNGNSTSVSKAYAGGLSGYNNLNQATYNSNITTNGATATVVDGNANSVAYSAGLTGRSSVKTTNLNAGKTINSGNITGLNNILASNKNGSAFAGGLFGLSGNLSSTSTVTLNSNINILSSINASVSGSAASLLNSSGTNIKGVAAGGVFGASLADTTVNSTIVVNNANNQTINATSNDTHSGAGGLFGALLNANYVQNGNFTNNRTTLLNNSSSSGAGVIGYLNVLEEGHLSPVTRGSVTSDALNEFAIWTSGGGKFTYSSTNPCAGPSAALCFEPNDPAALLNYILFHEPDNIDAAVEDNPALTHHSAEHAPHIPHNDHRSHHEEESEYNAIFNNIEYKGQIIQIGYPSYSFTTADGEMILIPFEFQGNHHSFGRYHLDAEGNFTKEKDNEENH